MIFLTRPRPGNAGEKEETMTNDFIRRILNEGIVDTKEYRYALNDCGHKMQIRRLPISSLDTTQALDGWEVLKEYERWPELGGGKK